MKCNDTEKQNLFSKTSEMTSLDFSLAWRWTR